jgi:uncharacterized protein YuzE
MKVRYDPSVDAAYLYFVEDSEQHSQAFTYACDPMEVKGQIHLDFDTEGRLIGIEVLQASKKLPQSILSTAENG